MKTIKKLVLGVFAFTLLFTTKAIAQEEEKTEDEFTPIYLTITTAHWTADDDVDFSDWKATEVEYFNNVTSKNDLIIGSGVYTHSITDDSTEIIFVSAYQTWNDIDAAGDVTNKLIEEAWPDEDARDAFFDKQGSYYSPDHSDEIYTSGRLHKPLNTESTEPLLFYVQKHTLSYDEEGDGFKEYFENVLMKNDLIKGIWINRHAWGANSRELLTAQAYESMEDFDKAWAENQRIFKEYMPEEADRDAFWKKFRKIFDGHSDALYENVPELAK